MHFPTFSAYLVEVGMGHELEIMTCFYILLYAVCSIDRVVSYDSYDYLYCTVVYCSTDELP